MLRVDAHHVQAACYKGCLSVGKAVVRLSRPESNGCDLGQKVYTHQGEGSTMPLKPDGILQSDPA